MAGFRIDKLIGREVLDSRGNPTVEAEASSGKVSARAIVPSGASVGVYESHELRDSGKRYLGKGVQKAVKNINLIERKLKGMDARDQKKLDLAMISLDGTVKKSRLGANAILAVSLASARLAAKLKGVPLYSHLAELAGTEKKVLPIPFANIINGGVHAGNELAMQEFMVAPVKARSFSQATQMVAEIYQTLKKEIIRRYGKNAANVGDEGGFAPPIRKAEQALLLIEKAIASAGYKGKIAIAMDAAASEFYNKGGYILQKRYASEELSAYYSKLLSKYSIISLEDPFEQNDLEAFSSFSPAGVQVVGDDLLVTNVERIKLALQHDLCDALLLKVNQVGSLTESIEAAILAKKNGWNIMVSHRSGDTEDAFIADLAVGLGCGQIKLGAPCRGERTAKYNQLLRIEHELGRSARYTRWSSPKTRQKKR